MQLLTAAYANARRMALNQDGGKKWHQREGQLSRSGMFETLADRHPRGEWFLEATFEGGANHLRDIRRCQNRTEQTKRKRSRQIAGKLRPLLFNRLEYLTS